MLYYLPLEYYEERYTAQLRDWTVSRFEKRGVEHRIIPGEPLSNVITTGAPLDAYNRCHFALTQTANLVRALRHYEQEVTSNDVIFIQDMFHPGFEAIPYIFEQLSPDKFPRIYTQCWAQSVDPNDFTFKMRRWMRHYEMIVDWNATGIFVASTCLKEMMQAGGIGNVEGMIHVVGLPFDIEEVRSRAGWKPGESQKKKNRVIFTSRLDREKQPGFFLELARRAKQLPLFKNTEFMICSGAQFLRGNDEQLLQQIHNAQLDGEITLKLEASKAEYYKLLGESKVHFNCALQDFVSFTMLEASALDTATLAPGHLSFPEALNNNRMQLYTPWVVSDALDKLIGLFELMQHDYINCSYPAIEHHKTLDRIIDIMGVGSTQ